MNTKLSILALRFEQTLRKAAGNIFQHPAPMGQVQHNAILPTPPSAQPERVQTTQEQVISAKPQAAANPMPVRNDVLATQKRLNQLIDAGKIQADHLDEDGKFGPKTKSMLYLFKRYMGVPSLSDANAIAQLNANPPGAATIDPEFGARKVQGPRTT